jgi:hypothetical protein
MSLDDFSLKGTAVAVETGVRVEKHRSSKKRKEAQ